MLCQLHLEPSVLGRSGRGTDDFNVLEPQTDLSQTVVSMKPRQLGPVKLNWLIWMVSRRQMLWLHCNPPVRLTREPLAVRYTQTLQCVCFNNRITLLYIGEHSHLILDVSQLSTVESRFIVFIANMHVYEADKITRFNLYFI